MRPTWSWHWSRCGREEGEGQPTPPPWFARRRRPPPPLSQPPFLPSPFPSLQARAALLRQEVPVGCVLVDEATGEVLATGSNQTNETRNVREEGDGGGGERGRDSPPALERAAAAKKLSPRSPPLLFSQATRHAELVAYDALRAADAAAGRPPRPNLAGVAVLVTCEPCLMCAAALGALGPARVVFGCANDRFGGCGSVAALHTAGDPATVACGGGGGKGREESTDGGAAGAPASPGFPATAGLRAADAVALLQAFYESGNPSAPVPRRAVVPVVVPEGGG